MPMCYERSGPMESFRASETVTFNPSHTISFRSSWPCSHSRPTWRIAPQQGSSWPSVPDRFALWPAKEEPVLADRPISCRPFSRIPSRMSVRVELSRPNTAVAEKCNACKRKLHFDEPRVTQRVAHYGASTGVRCLTCVQPHLLRQSGGWKKIAMEDRLPELSPKAQAARRHLYTHVDRHDVWRR